MLAAAVVPARWGLLGSTKLRLRAAAAAAAEGYVAFLVEHRTSLAFLHLCIDTSCSPALGDPALDCERLLQQNSACLTHQQQFNHSILGLA